MRHWKVLVTGIIAAWALTLTLASAPPVWAQANLENPRAGSSQSGIGLVSGWVCSANRVEVIFNDFPPLQAAYGTSRKDTEAVCGDDNNGFGLLFNWNLLGNGTHTVQVLVDGAPIGTVQVTVTTFDTEFLAGGSTLTCRIPHVPIFAMDTYVQWQQELQNFTIVDVRPHDSQFRGPECE